MIDGTHLLAALAGAGFVLAADWIRECWAKPATTLRQSTRAEQQGLLSSFGRFGRDCPKCAPDGTWPCDGWPNCGGPPF